MYVKLFRRSKVDENWAIMVVQPAILTDPTMVFYFRLAPQVLWNDLRGMGYNKTIYQCVHPLPVPMAARITKYLNKYVRRGICLIYMSRLSWRPEVDENWAIMVVQPAILTYPTMIFNFWLPPQVLWNGLRGIVINVFISGALRLPEKYEKPICGITRNIRHDPGIPF
jgi:hypothetical protein